MKKPNNDNAATVSLGTKKGYVCRQMHIVFGLRFVDYFFKFCLWAAALICVEFTTQNMALAQSNDFPLHAIKMIVPTSAGSGSDTTARYFAEQLAASLGVGVVVENRPGGNGIIAAMAVKQAPADGYTIFLGTNTHLSVNPVIVKDLPYDPFKDFKPLHGLARGMMVFVSNPQSKIVTINDLVSASKAKPHGLNVGTYTAGFHLSAAWFSSEASINFENIPYKGAPETFLGILGDQLDWAVSDLIAAMPQVKAGKLRAIAVTGETRHPDYPDIPTVKESGYPNYVNYSWTSLYVRSQTPEGVTGRLVDAINKIVLTKGTDDFIKSIGSAPLNLSPSEMREFQKQETERYRRIADGAKIAQQ